MQQIKLPVRTPSLATVTHENITENTHTGQPDSTRMNQQFYERLNI